MQQNFSSTKLPTTASTTTSGAGADWDNPTNITADDGSISWVGYFAGGDFGANLSGGDFGFQQLPDNAVIDGIELFVDGQNIGCYGDISISPAGTSSKSIGALSGSYGGATDLWGADSIDLADIASISVLITTGDVSGGDGYAEVDYLTITIYWHIEVENIETDVPTRVDYKVFSKDGAFLGLLPNVTSKLAFPEDINSAGTSIEIVCGIKADNEVTVSPLLTEDGEIITTESDLPILTTSTELLITRGNSPDRAIFKNGNRVKAWLYNKYYPNGKRMFSGQINKIRLKYGGGDATVRIMAHSDGLDLNNLVARGFPFSYTNDVVQDTYNGTKKSEVYGGSKGGGWLVYGQTWTTGAGITNLGAIRLSLRGTANVRVQVYDRPNGNLLGEVTKSVSTGAFAFVDFEFAQLIDVEPETSYFFAIWVDPGQSIDFYYNTTSVYADGEMYESSYSGGSGGGLFVGTGQEIRFRTMHGEPTTAATFTSDDPVTDMASGVFEDYNNRGGLITERDFEATGLSLSYTFVMAFIYDVITKILEMCPTGYYAYVDVGTAEIDIKNTTATPDFTIVKGKHINELDVELTIEAVKNYLLFTGAETAGVNLYREYKDSQSSPNYGIRTATKSDNRVSNTDTADAIGSTFIEEEADEQQNTALTVLNEYIDITLLTPGKTIGFKNFGNFIDDMVLQIVRREGNYSDGISGLTVGRLPVRMTDEIQRINRELLNEQTINNPSSPS